MRILFIGDVVGRPGRQAVREYLRRIKSDQSYDLVIANGENAAGGIGLTPQVANELLDAGVNVLTTGNHVWARRELSDHLQQDDRVLRPLNFPEGAPGAGVTLVTARNGRLVGVINLMGRVFMEPILDCPFRAAAAEAGRLRERTPVVLVDFHAEATSEKQAMGWWLDGRVTAVLGTHTHVQTADERVLPGGTAYITDVGMTGPVDSVIGFDRERILRRFTTQLPAAFQVAGGPVAVAAVELEVDPETGAALSIRRLAGPV